MDFTKWIVINLKFYNWSTFLKWPFSAGIRATGCRPIERPVFPRISIPFRFAAAASFMLSDNSCCLVLGLPVSYTLDCLQSDEKKKVQRRG